MLVKLITEQGTQTIQAQPGQTLLDAILAQTSLPVHAPCGGKGTCKKCAVYLVDQAGERAVLACCTPVSDGMVVRVPTENPLAVEIRTTGLSVDSDADLNGYGIACDIGTTTVVCRLVNAFGVCIASLGEGNAQRPYGADVIARIKASMEGKREVLTQVIRAQLSGMITRLCAENGVGLSQINRMTVAANTTMSHLLCGLAPDSMGAAPFTPLSLFGEFYTARELELPFEGYVLICPAVSGYVGGDITADLLAQEMDKETKPVLLIDVGTNGEMAIGCGNQFICCSTAAGPAFEGAQISHGMSASAGAISSVEVKNGELTVGIIGGGDAKGICGSGLIDAVAVMLDLGALDETGRILDVDEDEGEIPDSALPHLFLTEEEEPAFRLSDSVYVTQADVRKIQLGKGAIAAGEQILIQTFGVDYDDIGALFLAGGFGSYIRPESAARIGLIPEQLLDVTKAVGNAAAMGAQMALQSERCRQRLKNIQRDMRYIELSGMPAFNTAYMEAMMFPEGE